MACLSQASRDFIAHGAAVGERNNRLFNAACDMAGNDFTYPQAYQMLAPTAQRCGLEQRAIRDTVQSAFSKERTPAKQSRPKPPMPIWERAARREKTHQWQRMSATVQYKRRNAKQKMLRYTVLPETARAVFLACCERARRDNAEVFRASNREVAELANVERDTAHHALLCLVEAGYLVRCGYSPLRAGLFAFGKVVARTGQ